MGTYRRDRLTPKERDEADLVEVYPERCPRGSMMCLQCLIEGKPQCSGELPDSGGPRTFLNVYTGKITARSYS